MPKKTIDVDVVSLTTEIVNHKTRVTLVADYDGEENLEEQIIPQEKLTIEIPSHAPPPLKQK